MGTRNLTVVYYQGQYKVAQYGQWDGYPSGNGVVVLDFCRSLQVKELMEKFKENVSKCRYITEDEEKKRCEIFRNSKDYVEMYPEMHRDTGAGILNMIMRDGGLVLSDELMFAADSLFCEWLWLIDLDKNTFEGYEGFNKEVLSEDERFSFLEEKSANGYHPVKFVKEYSLDELPSEEQFLKDFGEEE